MDTTTCETRRCGETLTMLLREYQLRCVDAVLKEWERVQSTLVVAATGTGKTVMLAEIIRRMQPRRSLVIAHRKELIDQARERIQAATGLECDIEMGFQRSDDHGWLDKRPVVVATVQSLVSGRDKKRMEKWKPDEFGIIITDEAHHICAKSYLSVIDYFKQNKDLRILGVTATPDRADEKALQQVFDSVAFKYDIMDAIEDGWLVPITQQFCPVSGLDFSHVRTTAGDFNEGDLAKIMEAEENIQGVCHPAMEVLYGLTPKTLSAMPVPEWTNYLLALGKQPRRAIVFTVSVAQAEACCNIFNRVMPGIAEWVCGSTPTDDRESTLGRFKSGKTAVVANCGVLIEGFDAPATEVIFQARPTKSRALYTQTVGRSTRPLPGLVDGLATPEERKAAIKASGKPYCIAEGTLILTDVGLVPIECVTSKMKLWDGVDFVTNDGIIFRGKRTVIEYAGLSATEDHRVWTKEGWTPFGQCASKQIAISVTAFGRTAIREAHGYYRRNITNFWTSPHSLHSNGMRLWTKIVERLFLAHLWKGWMSYLWTTEAVPSLAFGAMCGSEVKVHQSEGKSVSEVWWQRNRIQILGGQRNGVVGSGEFGSASRNDDRQNRQRWTLRAWKLALGKPASPKQQSAWTETDSGSSRLQDSTPTIPYFGRSLATFTAPRLDMESNTANRECEGTVQRTERVFDILNAGPRNRFTAAGLLVSNCRIIDFSGNSGRHKLICALDILGGKMKEAALEYAIQKTKDDGKPVLVSRQLTEAEVELAKKQKEADDRKRLAEEARKRKVVAKSQFHHIDVDPFGQRRFQTGQFGKHGGPRMPGHCPTEKQLRVIGNAGINPYGLTRKKASWVIGILVKNRWRLPKEYEWLKQRSQQHQPI